MAFIQSDLTLQALIEINKVLTSQLNGSMLFELTFIKHLAGVEEKWTTSNSLKLFFFCHFDIDLTSDTTNNFGSCPCLPWSHAQTMHSSSSGSYYTLVKAVVKCCLVPTQQ